MAKKDRNHRGGLAAFMTLAGVCLWLSSGRSHIAHAETLVPLTVRVEHAEGGHVQGMPVGRTCRTECDIEAVSGSLVGLLAEADSGYRFGGWLGACHSTIGPLCTLAPERSASTTARFIPVDSQASPASVDAVLLLHGKSRGPSSWNSVVDHQFAGDCPTLYGGVALSHRAPQDNRGLGCFRIAFGYYGALRSGRPDSGDSASLPQLSMEIRAALVGIRELAPNARVVLVGQGRGAAAARELIESMPDARRTVFGLVHIVPPGRDAPRSEPALGVDETVTDREHIAATVRELLRLR